MVLIRGAELAHEQSGRGRHLIWGHGLTGSRDADDELGLFDWDRIAGVASVVRYDARGHGASESTPVPDDYHWRELARDQLELADALGIDDYVAGGASMGCATALHAATLAPHRIRALVLAIPPTAWATRAEQADAYRAMADLIEIGDHDTLLRGAAELPPPDPLAGDPRWTERFPELLRTADPVRLARVFRGAATADLPPPDQIAALQVPTLILAWTGDPGHPVGTAARLQELMPHAQLALAVTYSGLLAWTDRVIDFLATVSA